MRGRAWRIAMLNGALLAALAMPAWAGSGQAPLAVSVVVPARCAVRIPGTLVPAELSATGAREAVAMRCTGFRNPENTPAIPLTTLVEEMVGTTLMISASAKSARSSTL